VFDELVMHEVLAYQVNVEMRSLHPPDLAGFQGLERDSTFLLHECAGKGGRADQRRQGKSNGKSKGCKSD
jgi:hypothetical protein